MESHDERGFPLQGRGSGCKDTEEIAQQRQQEYHYIRN